MKFVLKIFLLSVWALTGCGVKGNPQPPLTAPVLGRGEPNYSKATEKVKLKKKTPPSDWDEPDDFSEEKEK
jgi:hypothetical protein